MKAVFMGTPAFAVPALCGMLEDGHHIAAVFTQPDRPTGRGFKLALSPVKEFALGRGLTVYQPEKLSKSEAAGIMADLAPDVAVVVAYGQLLPRRVLDIPRLGCVNVHGSLLPAYRGAAPIQWAVINGEGKTGVTTMLMDAGLDTGPMLQSTETEIGPEETAGDLYRRLALLGARCLSSTLAALGAGSATPLPQPAEGVSWAPMLKKEMGLIDFARPALALHNLIRGLNPSPGAYTYLDGKRLKVHIARPASLSGPPGVLLSRQALIVGAGDSSLELLEVQLEGARRITGAELIRGRRLEPGHPLGDMSDPPAP
jgi:methionyl-tRNA formyltransferase